ncbi:MAG TPA: hypothetical protein VHU23_13285 [Rhizomicrobium sp.]|nr:hypothetical protein [Rhizomicrobium sp.]
MTFIGNWWQKGTVSRNPAELVGYKYKIVELSLARVFGVLDADMPAFRARIRHLRNIGVPAVPKVGTGRTVDFSREHIIQLLIALEAELLGLPANQAAALSRQALSELLSKIETAAKIGGAYFMKAKLGFSSVDHINWGDNDHMTQIVGHDTSTIDPRFVAAMEERHTRHRRASINVAASLRRLDEELTALTARR